MVGGVYVATVVPQVTASTARPQRMSSKSHTIRRLCGPSLLVKPARYATDDMDLIARPSAEQTLQELADENWRDDSGAPRARQPKRRHIGAVSAIVGAVFDAATTPAARKHLSQQELAPTMRGTSGRTSSAMRLSCFPPKKLCGSGSTPAKTPRTCDPNSEGLLHTRALTRAIGDRTLERPRPADTPLYFASSQDFFGIHSLSLPVT